MATRKQFANGNIVTAVLDDWLDRNPGFNLVEIAERIGVEKSKHCFMSQVRSGRSKLPISKILPLATLLEEDPRPLVLAALDEYYPELKDALIRTELLNVSAETSLKDLRELIGREKQAV